MNEIYYVDITNLDNIDLNKIDLSYLSLKENIKDKRKKYQSLTGYLLLKKVLEKKGIYSFEYRLDSNNKPYLKDSSIFFNITHSNNIVALIISDSEVGIDCEMVDSNRDFNKLISYVFTDNEKQMYHKLKGELMIEFFYETWVKKEAYFKMKGTGLSKEFKNIELDYPVTLIKDLLGNRYYITATQKYELVELNITEL